MATGSKFGWGVVAALAVAGGGWFGLENMRAAQLRAEVGLRREAAGDLAKLRAENRRLASEALAPEKLEALRADRAAVRRLRTEVDALKARPAPGRNAVAAPAPARAAKVPVLIPAAKWTNAGHSTPAAAFETALWAAAGGDVDALGRTLSLEGVARQKADALFVSLSPDARNRFSTTDRLIAFMTAKDIPLGQMAVLTQVPQGDEQMALKALVEGPEGGRRTAGFTLRRYPEGWKVVVPESAIEKYSAQLREQLRTVGAK